MSSATPEVVALVARLGNALGVATRPTTLVDELKSATAGVRAIFSAAACSCALAESDGESIRFVAADGVGAKAIVGTVMSAERGIAGWVTMTGQPIVIADVRADPRFARDVAEETKYVPTSIMAAPLMTRDGRVLGVIEVLDRATAVENTGRDLDVLGLIGSQLAATVQLCSVYDAFGSALLTAAAGAESDADFARTLDGLAAADGEDRDRAALAKTFHDLAAVGPGGLRMATTILDAVLANAKVRE